MNIGAARVCPACGWVGDHAVFAVVEPGWDLPYVPARCPVCEALTRPPSVVPRYDLPTEGPS